MAVRAVADTQLVVVLLAPTQAEVQRSASIQGVYVARDGRTMRIWEPKAP
jgi:predicted GNAT family acetyltransferase